MCRLAPKHAVFILEKAAYIQREQNLKEAIQTILRELLKYHEHGI